MIAAVSSLVEYLVLALIFGAIVIVGVWQSLRQSRKFQRRIFDLRALAERLGFEDFNPKPDERFAVGWGFLECLNRGKDRYASNILRGTYPDEKLFVFDYHFQTGEGKNQQEHHWTFLMLIFKEVFPRITIAPESLRLKIAEAFGVVDDIDFESAEFSRRYCVRSPDKKFAYDICNPQMIDYLLANPGLKIEIQGPALLLAFEPLLPVSQIEMNLQRLIGIRSRLPEYLFANK